MARTDDWSVRWGAAYSAEEIERLETAMASPDFYARDPAAFERSATDLQDKQAELAAAEERWLELELMREELEGA